jgi:hypothetical protein
VPKPCGGCGNLASWALGGSNLAWSPDGTKLMYVTNRVGGSGLSGGGIIDVATGVFTAFDQRQISFYSLGFLFGVWFVEPESNAEIIAIWDGSVLHQIDPADGTQVASEGPMPAAPRPGTLSQLDGGLFLAGSWVDGQPIVLLNHRTSRALPSGVSPVISPDENWIAYFRDESLRLVRTDGSDDHEVVDLTPLGGRDRHFASTPDCYPGRAPACSYRPPLISWTALP